MWCLLVSSCASNVGFFNSCTMTQIMKIAVCLMVVIALVACAPLETGESLKTDESLGLALGLKKLAKSFDFSLALGIGESRAYPAYGYHAYGYPYYGYGGGAAAAAASGWGGAAAAAAAGK